MDQVVLIKIVSLLIYPVGLAFSLSILGCICMTVRKRRAAQYCFIVALSILWLASTPAVSNRLVSGLESQYPQQLMSEIAPHDLIVVLGGGLRLPAKPAQYIQLNRASDRYLYSSRLFSAGKAPHIVILGGNLYAQPGLRAESYYARQLLTEWGVPFEAILIDEVSRTTQQNAEQLEELLELNFPEKLDESITVLLVTSALHMPRARHIVSVQLGSKIEITSASADVLIQDSSLPIHDRWLPNAASLQLSTMALHEIYGLFFAKLSQYISE